MDAADGPGTECPGTGRRWGSGTGQPICPQCHRGPRFMGVRPPVFRAGRVTGSRWTGVVPPHPPRVR